MWAAGFPRNLAIRVTSTRRFDPWAERRPLPQTLSQRRRPKRPAYCLSHESDEGSQDRDVTAPAWYRVVAGCRIPRCEYSWLSHRADFVRVMEPARALQFPSTPDVCSAVRRTPHAADVRRSSVPVRESQVQRPLHPAFGGEGKL